MWITRDVEIPDELIAAQRNGRLVLFAGAGVSIGSPSNLPSFTDLADQIAGSAATRIHGEPLDQFLGRCAQLGVDVQRRAREILGAPASEPTTLHRELIRLFGGPEHVRLVTTNFDGHFGKAAVELYAAGVVPFYRAPALPLGATASGIIHVHGALEERRHPLILTDADFGRAYLTEGWATRFLLDLFLNNAVCFIGYGHADPTMQYLARALVPGTARFALTTPGDDGRWSALGVRPVHYPLRDAEDRHSALSDAILAWSTDAARGVLDHEHQIKELVSVPPVAEPHLTDYLRDALRDPTRRGFFLRYARGPEWLQFARDSGVLDPLFGATTSNEEGLEKLAGWLAENFMVQHPSDLLALLRAKQMQIGHLLWQILAWHLSRVEPRPSSDLLARWVTVLAITRGHQWSARSLSSLVERCSEGALDSAVMLYGHLAQPRVVVKDPWGDDTDSNGVPRLNLEVVPVGDQHDLQRAWENALKPRLGVCFQAVATHLMSSISRAHELLRTGGGATSQWDPMSYGRAGIESHPQDAHPSGMDVVIDAARDTLEFAIRERQAAAEALINLWEGSSSQILRRLAIHGRIENPLLVPGDELERILSNGWLDELSLKHEVFRLLAKAYAAADEPTRESFLKRAREVMKPTRGTN